MTKFKDTETKKVEEPRGKGQSRQREKHSHGHGRMTEQETVKEPPCNYIIAQSLWQEVWTSSSKLLLKLQNSVQAYLFGGVMSAHMRIPSQPLATPCLCVLQHKSLSIINAGLFFPTRLWAPWEHRSLSPEGCEDRMQEVGEWTGMR